MTTIRLHVNRVYFIIFFAGINLILIQWVLLRELTALLFGTELVILLVSAMYFIGISIGFRVSSLLSHTWLKPMGSFMLLLHLTLPVWFRLLAVFLDRINAYGVMFLVLPVCVPFVVSAFYSIFLPLYVDKGSEQLTTLYALEVLGSIVGVLCLVFFASLGLVTVFALYTLILIGMLSALGMVRHWCVSLAILAAVWLWLFPALNRWSNTLWYQQTRGFPEESITVFTGYSAYQKIDILRTPAGRYYLYLDGLEHFGSDSSSLLNLLMGWIPSSIFAPEDALVFGAGSMQMAWMIALNANHVTTVEIDQLVVDTSIQFLTDFNHMDTLTNRTIIIDDAKHFIATTSEQYDFIATDLPATLSLQTGMLYSVSFFEQVHHRLRPDGVFVVNLISLFEPDALESRRITAALLQVFNDVIIVHSDTAGWSFAYVSDNMPFTVEQVQMALDERNEARFVIYDRDMAEAIVGNADPITIDTLDVVLRVNASRIIGAMR